MANFNAGIILTILSVYMFIVFSIIYASNNVAIDYDLVDPGATQADLGFLSINNGCSGSGTQYCFNTGDAWFKTGCELIPGCSWNNDTLCIDEGCCDGNVFNKTSDFNCNIVNDSYTCQRVGCLWKNTQNVTTDVSILKSVSGSPVINTFKIMYGFNPSVTDPSLAYGLFSFFAVWIPSIMMIFCMYLLLPFISG